MAVLARLHAVSRQEWRRPQAQNSTETYPSFKDPLPNSVYAIHDYSNYGFPRGERNKGDRYKVHQPVGPVAFDDN